MTDKGESSGTKLVGTVAAFAAAYGARKLIEFTWKQVTGREPPSDPEDLQVGVGEALSWAIVTGVGIAAARLLAKRATAKRMQRHGGS
ncbi:MAG TPA: DUF4235 domain-containing protein [Streptosporangiaceae bacterium]|nr:DUF4235 domain-containing protein [Streptosporangiaceae bacterium]